MTPLDLAISPCPNDTFAFHALVHGLVPGAEAVRVTLADVEALNRAARAGTHEVSKVSYAVVPALLDDHVLLRSGGALGRGVGPLVVAREPAALADLAGARLAIPGRDTTAWLLLRHALPGVEETADVHVAVFDEIMDLVLAGEVDAGVLIHEGRFTYTARGLEFVADLGEAWEASTGKPIPLGGIVARRDLGPERIAAIDVAIAASVRHALAHPADSRGWVAEHAAELDEDVRARHVALYVNDFTVDVGDEGADAVRALLAAAGCARDPFAG